MNYHLWALTENDKSAITSSSSGRSDMVRTGDINCWKDISRVVCFLLLPIQQVLLTGNIAGSMSHIETVRLSKASTETYRVTHKIAQGIRIHYASQVFSDFIVHFQYYEQVRGFVFFCLVPVDFTHILESVWLHEHRANLMSAPVPVKQPLRIWTIKSYESTKCNHFNTTKNTNMYIFHRKA